MRISNPKMVIVFSIIIAIIFLFNLTVKAQFNEDENDEKIYETISNRFVHEEYVDVFVRLKDTSNLSYKKSESPEKIKDVLNQRKKYFGPIRDNILSSLSEDEFKLKATFYYGNSFAGSITAKGVDKLKNDQRISKVYPARKGKFLSTPESNNLTTGLDLINARKLQQIKPKLTGKGQTICIIDSGINYNHPDLGNCTPGNVGCRILYDKDFCVTDNNCIHDDDAMDVYGHGTHVAGIAAANGKMGGIAPKANMIALKVGVSDVDEVALKNAIDWCSSNKSRYNISVITLSLNIDTNESNQAYNSTTCPRQLLPDITEALETAYNLGIFISEASGNFNFTNGINYPACLQNVTSVGAVTLNDELWSKTVARGTNRYEGLDLLAPGSNIYSTAFNSSLGSFINSSSCSSIYNETYGVCSGTSMAAPYVAGLAALLQEAYNGTLSPMQIENILKSSGKPVYDSITKLYFPRIDALAALELDWPTNRHTNRRDGFTVMQGDMPSPAFANSYNLYLTNASDVEYVVRSSIADIDGNGYNDVVSVTHEKYDSVKGILFGYEHYRQFDEPFCSWLWPHCWVDSKRFEVNLNRSVLSPPTIGNIDNNLRKEILAPRRNGSLLVFNVTNLGLGLISVNQMWEFVAPRKYSPAQGLNISAELSGSAVADVNLDGEDDVILTDWAGSRGAADWPGQVYIFYGNGTQMVNATFNNSGAFGSPSIANIDDDDYPEIIIPSFYGVWVYDYDASNNSLVRRWNNTDGLIDSEIVVFDVDRDNEYELIYTTTTKGCATLVTYNKTCQNRTYIRDAKTGANEGPSPIDYGFPFSTRVAPTVANLDSDSNMEIVLIGTNSDADFGSGKVVAYDAATGNREWIFNDSGILKVSFASVDIADITGDGNLDIVFAENNGSKVYILRKNGSLDFTYVFSSFIDNALSIGDIDSDGRAEIAIKRAGSPVAFSVLTGLNNQPEIAGIDNVTGIAGALININTSGQVMAFDPDNNVLNYTYDSLFNSSGQWQTTAGDVGTYSVLVEASDGNLSAYKYVNVIVFSEATYLVNNFTDGSTKKLLNFSQAGNQTVRVRLPKNANLVYSRLKVGGYNS